MPVGRDKNLSLRVYLDKCLLEVYAHGGVGAMCAVVQAGSPAGGAEVFATQGAATVNLVRAWRMKPPRFSMEHYVVPG